MSSPDWLLEHAATKHSQHGEEGIVSKALSLLPRRDRLCVEFGAWDGYHLSNVRSLIEDEGYSAIMIEGDEPRYNDLVKNCQGDDSVTPVNAFVGFDSATGLDTILRPLGVPRDFDFLSVDIDGNDYHVWKATTEYRPKLVCIEYNPTIPTEVEFVQPANPRVSQGSSLLSLCQLADQKGYELISVLGTNAFFVDAQYFPLFDISDNSPHALRKDCSKVTWMFCGYDGTVHLSGAKTLPWHGLDIDERDVQPLPSVLRGIRGDYSPVKSMLFKLHRSWRRLRQDKKAA